MSDRYDSLQDGVATVGILSLAVCFVSIVASLIGIIWGSPTGVKFAVTVFVVSGSALVACFVIQAAINRQRKGKT